MTSDPDMFGKDVILRRRSLENKADALVAHLRVMIAQEIPESRDRSIAITQLDTAMLWIHHAIAHAIFEAD